MQEKCEEIISSRPIIKAKALALHQDSTMMTKGMRTTVRVTEAHALI